MGKETLPQGEVETLIKEFEIKLARLRNIYEQYFMGMERIPPNTQRKEIVRLARRLENLYIRSTAGKFRIRALVQRFNTYKVYWNRTCKQIEEGTYVRDIQRARRNQKNREKVEKMDLGPAAGQADDGSFDLDLDLDLSSIDLNAFSENPNPPSDRPVRTSQPTPLISTKTPEPAKPAELDDRAAKLARLKRKLKPGDPSKIRGASSDKEARIKAAKEKLAQANQRPVANKEDGEARRVYNALVAAKKKCNESTSNLNYETLKASLTKQKQHLKETRGAKNVAFNVVIKDGKAFLKPELKK